MMERNVGTVGKVTPMRVVVNYVQHLERMSGQKPFFKFCSQKSNTNKQVRVKKSVHKVYENVLDVDDCVYSKEVCKR